MIKRILGALLRRVFGRRAVPLHLAVYDPATHRAVPLQMDVYDPATQVVVPTGMSIYDADVFGRYDLASQVIVPKSEGERRTGNLDVLMEQAQRYRRHGRIQPDSERYAQTLPFLVAGSGILLDACTPRPRDDVRDCAERLGYTYRAADLNGDGQRVDKQDLTSMTYQDASVAAVLSVDTLEHIPQWKVAVTEIYRVLQDEGLFVVHVPCYYFDKSVSEPIREGADPWDHVVYFSARDLMAALDLAGFVVLRAVMNFDYGAVVLMAVKSVSIKQAST
ncbi:MAG: methyltransferase domain-containing protein [Burkholderiales bacterium]|jgi:hypothetical protein